MRSGEWGVRGACVRVWGGVYCTVVESRCAHSVAPSAAASSPLSEPSSEVRPKKSFATCIKNSGLGRERVNMFPTSLTPTHEVHLLDPWDAGSAAHDLHPMYLSGRQVSLRQGLRSTAGGWAGGWEGEAKGVG